MLFFRDEVIDETQSISLDDEEEQIAEGAALAESMHEDIPASAWCRNLDQQFEAHKQFQVCQHTMHVSCAMRNMLETRHDHICVSLHPKITYTYKVSVAEGLRLAGLGFRMWKYVKRERAAGRVPIMDPFAPPKAGML